MIREVIYGIVVAVLHNKPPAASDLASFNRELQSALQHLRVVPGRRGFIWNWEFDPSGLEGMLWPILRSAADLLTSERQDRIGQCADDRGCGWLFLDTTKNRSRRWCAMEDCGNRAKARRHYQRSRRQGTRDNKRDLMEPKAGRKGIQT
jgi:predicted RNA-binding Zn ribbon-like protein